MSMYVRLTPTASLVLDNKAFICPNNNGNPYLSVLHTQAKVGVYIKEGGFSALCYSFSKAFPSGWKEVTIEIKGESHTLLIDIDDLKLTKNFIILNMFQKALIDLYKNSPEKSKELRNNLNIPFITFEEAISYETLATINVKVRPGKVSFDDLENPVSKGLIPCSKKNKKNRSYVLIKVVKQDQPTVKSVIRFVQRRDRMWEQIEKPKEPFPPIFFNSSFYR